MPTNRRPSQNQSNRQRNNRTEQEPVTVSLNPAPAQAAGDEPKLPLERLGDMLRRIREERGDDLQQIADYLCIRRNFLAALENSRYDEFPADAYVIGFLRSYANYLGIDGKEAIDRYRNEMAGRRKKPILLIPAPITEGRTPSAAIMIGAAVAALVIYILWYGISSTDRASVSSAPALPSTAAPSELTASTEAVLATPAPAASLMSPPPDSAGITLSSAAPLPALASTTPPAATQPTAPASPTAAASSTDPQPAVPAADDSGLSVRATQSAWVLVANNKGHPIFDKVMKAGDSYKIPAGPGLTLTTGNGAGIILTLNGKDLPRLATGMSRVIRNMPLDNATLRSLPANPDE
ncbi:MAG: RodZ domain-containing protein [Alphaproteobacteria bacterium]